MSRTGRVAVVASLDGVRYVSVGFLAATSILFFLLAIVDSFRTTSLRNTWLVSFLLDLASGMIEHLSSWLGAAWMLQLRRFSTLVLAFSLWALASLVNAALRAFNSRITRALDLAAAEEASTPTYHD